MITYCTFPRSEVKNPKLMDSHTVSKPKIPAVNVYFLRMYLPNKVKCWRDRCNRRWYS